MEEPSAQLALVDRLISGVLLNVGWILMLIGLEPVGARLITGSKIYSVPAVFVLTTLGLLALLAGIAWPPSSQEMRTLITPVVEPIARSFVWILLFFITALWLVNAVPVFRAGDIAVVREDLKAIRSDFRRYVLPRHLTADQIATIAAHLSKYDPRHAKIQVIAGDNEASNYRADFHRALEQGGWTIDSIDYVANAANSPIAEGLSMQVHTPMVIPAPRPDPKHPTPDMILRDAFNLARVQLDGTVGSGSAHNIPYSLTLIFGHRRRNGFGYGSPEMVMKMVPKEEEQ